MRRFGLGQLIFAASVILAGVLGFAFRDFALVFQLVPKTIAGHDTLAIASGEILLTGGLLLLLPQTARFGAFLLAIVLLLFVLALRIRPLLLQPLMEASWYGVAETLSMSAAAWTIFSMLPARRGEPLAQLGSARLGQILFALCLLPFGLAHFFYVGQTAPLIPSWLPFHAPLAYATGAAHIAAGIAILFGILPRLAATLEAAMVSLFTLLIWVPAVIATPKPEAWTELAVSLAITGAAWAVAESLGDARRGR